MRKLTKRVYLKIRIYLIILLSIVIGASYMFVYEEISELRSDYNESMVVWNDYKERKGIGAVASATSLDMPQAEKEVRLPSPEVESVEDKIRAIAEREGFEDADLLIRIASCESGLIPRRDSDVSYSSAKGLFQILDLHGLTAEERYDIDISTVWTINKIKAGGLSAWNASKKCWSAEI